MEFAVNFSNEARELRQRGAIRFDRWKCPDWPDLIAEVSVDSPVYVHFDLQAGSGALAPDDLDQVARLLDATGTRYVNIHAAPRQPDFPDIPRDSIDPTDVKVVTDRLLRDIGLVAERFGSDRVIVENIPYRGDEGTALRAGADAGVIRRVCDEIGCGLLLDIAHARLTATFLDLDVYRYLADLPVERLVEVHVTGIGRGEDGRLLDHLPLTEEDWQVTEWCFDQIRSGAWREPWVVTLEYGGIGEIFAWRSDASVISQEVPRLFSIVHG